MFKKKNNNRGQIGIFVVIGVILVIGTIFLISVNFDSIPIFSDEKSSYNVKEFVESCLTLESQTAIDKIGISGGWIYPESHLTYTDRDTIKEINRNAKGFNFLEKNKMPYWYYYNGEYPDGEFVTNIPEYDSDSEDSIKSQMKRYLIENLEDNCFQNFEQFEDLYDIKYDTSKIDIDLKFGDEEITVDLNMKLDMYDFNSDNYETLSNFRTKTENKIFLPYHLAKEIINAEKNSSFMEIRVMNLLRPYQSSKGRDLLPPQKKTELIYDFDPWRVPEVEKLAKMIISSEISRVQFLNTYVINREIPEGLEDNEFVLATNEIYTKDYLTENTNLDEDNPKLFKKFKELKVRPTFEPFFPIYFKIKQAIGNMILLPKPEMFAGFIPIYFTKYSASYEITAPIVFEIRATENINDNFVFNLPIEINIKHNMAFANNYQDEIEMEELPKQAKSLICDNSQFVSEIITFNLSDPINFGDREINKAKKGVEDARIEFTCKNLATCFIGNTKLSGDENVPEEFRTTTSQVSFRLPIDCEPGTLKISKFGYQTVTIDNLNPTIEQGYDFGELNMSSPKNLKVSVGLSEPGSGEIGTMKSIKDFHEGFIIFESLNEPDFVRVLNVNSENQNSLDIDLLPGDYKVTGILMYNKEVLIPAEGDIPETSMKTWLAGGIEIESFNLDTLELLKYDHIKIRFVEYLIPTNYDELGKSSEAMAQLKEFSVSPRLYKE